jgi:hypothetical protein
LDSLRIDRGRIAGTLSGIVGFAVDHADAGPGDRTAAQAVPIMAVAAIIGTVAHPRVVEEVDWRAVAAY